MNWALVIWVVSSNNFTVFERFESLDNCLNKRETVISAFQQVDPALYLALLFFGLCFFFQLSELSYTETDDFDFT